MPLQYGLYRRPADLFFFIIIANNVSHDETHFVVRRKKAKNQGAGIMNPRAYGVRIFTVFIMGQKQTLPHLVQYIMSYKV